MLFRHRQNCKFRISHRQKIARSNAEFHSCTLQWEYLIGYWPWRGQLHTKASDSTEFETPLSNNFKQRGTYKERARLCRGKVFGLTMCPRKQKINCSSDKTGEDTLGSTHYSPKKILRVFVNNASLKMVNKNIYICIRDFITVVMKWD